MTKEMIPFEVDTSRIIDLLAKQIYQSPLALLRENVQNAFDAICERVYQDDSFTPKIDIVVKHSSIEISDNGIGMSPTELKKHFWRAGSSSKNTEEARAAGVVGTFGIGAMANFGIAETLTVETESARTAARSWSKAEKSRLSIKEECVEFETRPAQGRPGTKIVADLSEPGSVDLAVASRFIQGFVGLVRVPVYVNEELVSQRDVKDEVPKVAETKTINIENAQIGSRLSANVELVISNNADIWLQLKSILWDERPISGCFTLRSGTSILRTFRSGFGLAAAPISSTYQFGGVVDLLVLEPTAGREAITSDGIQFLQTAMKQVDQFVSEQLSSLDECNSSTAFMSWVIDNRRFDLAGNLTIDAAPEGKFSLKDAAELSKKLTLQVYKGADKGIINAHATEDTKVLILARQNPRRGCQDSYLSQFGSVNEISDNPVATKLRSNMELNSDEWSLAYRVENIIADDYFLKVRVSFGQISHGLPIIVDRTYTEEIVLVLNPEAASVRTILQMYSTDFESMRGISKDFVRNIIFPRISDLVPSSTRQGAEAFLKIIRSKREAFEYKSDDLDDLHSVWEDYRDGKVTLEHAISSAKQYVDASMQTIEVALPAKDVLSDIIENENLLKQSADSAVGNTTDVTFDPQPAIIRTDIKSNAKLLTIDDCDQDLRGYRCFLSLTSRAYSEFGEFFFQPHTTSIVWSGQKAIFVFIHHSRKFGLYYDLQAIEPLQAVAGGEAFQTSTIIFGNGIYIPVPAIISPSFIPATGTTKKFEIRADIIRTGVNGPRDECQSQSNMGPDRGVKRGH